MPAPKVRQAIYAHTIPRVNPSVIARLASLESQINSLRLQLRGSPGVSTAGGGSLSIRTLQLGFAAELTGSYNSTTGYPWKRLKLEPPAFVDPTVQPEGVDAFEISGDESLVSGTSVWMEPSPDAVGYIFTVSASAASDSSACSAFMSSIRSGRCYRLTIDVAGDGSCFCVPTGQSANLTWDDTRDALTSDELLYGCPPGVYTTFCPSPTGAPGKWNLVVAGFTGGSTNFNQNYTASYDTGETWDVTKGGVTVTAVQTAAGEWTLTLDDGSTVVEYDATGVTDCCAAITFNLVDGGGSSDPPATLTLSPATSCGDGPAYTPILDNCTTDCMRNARLRWEPVAGSGAATILFDPPTCGIDSNGNKTADFSTDNALLCTGDEAGDCGNNLFTVRVTCGCSPFAETGRAPCGISPVCSGLSGEYTIPQSICARLALTAGVDCAGLDGLVLRLPLVGGPYENPLSSGFMGRQSDGSEVVAWGSLTGTTTLSSGLIFDNQGAVQCGKADPTSPYSSPFDANSYPSLPITIRFPVTAGITFTVSYEGGEWLLKYTSTTLVATAVDDAAWTLTFDTSSLASLFGQDEVTFTLGAVPFLQYFAQLGTLIGLSALTNAAGVYAFAASFGTCDDQATLVPFNDIGPPGGCWLLSGDAATYPGLYYSSCPDQPCNSSTYPTTAYSVTYTPDDPSCEDNPIPTTYVCVNGVCTAVYDGSGTSLADCLAACAGSGPVDCDACGLGGQTATLACSMGTFTATWAGAAGVYSATFTDGSFVGSIRVDCVNGLPLVLTRYDGSGNVLCTVNVTSATCGPPAIFTFPGTCTSGGTATVTT